MLRYALIGKRLKANAQGEPGVALTFQAIRSDGTGTDDESRPAPMTEWSEWVTPREAAKHHIGDEFALEKR